MEYACMLVHHGHLILLFFTICILASPITIPRRLKVKLIHRDSFSSPYYNPSATMLDRSTQAMESSMARFAYLQQRTQNNSFTTDDIRSELVPINGTIFLVNFSIGEPPLPQLVAMDTGSSLLWIQCLPCIECFHQSEPIFDPSKSTTYANLPCNSVYCDVCSAGSCPYDVRYAGGTNSEGTLATEKITFTTSDEGTTNVSNMVFGCSHQSEDTHGVLSGILGLGQEKFSLVSQLMSSTFSYCIGDICDPKYKYNQLILGDGAKIEGYSTPMEVYDGHYFLTLEGIIIGEKRLMIDAQIFKRNPSSGSGGVVIDSGATYTFLVKAAYKSLKAGVSELIFGLLREVVDPNHPNQLCYNGTVSRDLQTFPSVTFQFARGADLVLEITSMFHQTADDILCLAALETPISNLNIIGIMAQQSYNVAYDLKEMEVSFQRIECELLED